MTSPRALAVVILAAGKGKRMGNPDLAKVLAPLHGRPLLGYVLDQARALRPDAIVPIIGHQRDAVRAYVEEECPEARCVEQLEQLGTGHAVLQTRPLLMDAQADVIILSGDVPLLTSDTLHLLVRTHRDHDASCTVLTTTVDDPTGYGRIVRADDGALLRIVEQKDATPEEQAIQEINSGVYVVRSEDLYPALDLVQNANAQGEYYVTDIINILQRRGATVIAHHTDDAIEVQGINTVADLERASELYAQRS
ncbi:MAG: NTP transferase domain-containing protein [Bacteroidetes bacterium]|nr:NTP transferase domain-containing protein [Bacteroidota bacterium]